jgi:2-methylcitrate dehydratase PrpD
MTHPVSTDPISTTVGEFAEKLTWDDIPAPVQQQARLLLLDSIGIAFASGTYGFAGRASSAVRELAEGGTGQASVIGQSDPLPLRDAVLLNGLLIHGLDFDDTHLQGVVHASASAAATSLGVAEHRALPGRDLLTAYVLGIEVAARLGIAANGGFHQVGFHPTGLVGAYASAVVAAKLSGLDASGIAQAQGFVHSLASGSLEFLASGAWTKRAHPGWAGVAGITAAAFARSGFESPERPYEGRFGLYARHLVGREYDVEAARAALGDVWETTAVAVKPFPACHFTHAFADAAIALRDAHGLAPDDIASIRCLIGEGEISTVCEPREAKLRPQSAYDAQFSLPYITAAAFVRGRFTLAELEEAAWTDPAILRLAERVTHESDPESDFPRYFSGEVVVTTRDGRELSHREQVNRGAGSRPLGEADVVEKFQGTAGLALDANRVDEIIDAVLTLDRADDVRGFARRLRAGVTPRRSSPSGATAATRVRTTRDPKECHG